MAALAEHHRGRWLPVSHKHRKGFLMAGVWPPRSPFSGIAGWTTAPQSRSARMASLRDNSQAGEVLVQCLRERMRMSR